MENDRAWSVSRHDLAGKTGWLLGIARPIAMGKTMETNEWFLDPRCAVGEPTGVSWRSETCVNRELPGLGPMPFVESEMKDDVDEDNQNSDRVLC